MLDVLEKTPVGNSLLRHDGGVVFQRELTTDNMARPPRVDAWVCGSPYAKQEKNVGLLPGDDQGSKPLSTLN